MRVPPRNGGQVYEAASSTVGLDAHVAMAYVAMAYIAMAYIAMAYIVMAYVVVMA